jgi:hypothetical protein
VEEDGDGGLLTELLTSSVSLARGGGGGGGGGSKRRLDRFVQAAGAIFAEDQLLMYTLVAERWEEAKPDEKENDEIKSKVV